MNKKIQYILDTFKMYYPLEEYPVISYGSDNSGKLVIKKSVPDNFFDSEVQINSDKVIWKEWKSND